MKVPSGPGKLVSSFSRLQAFPSPPAGVPATLLRGSCTPENGRNLPTSDLASLPSGFFPVVLSQSPTRGSPPTLDKPAPRQQGSRRQNLPVTQVQGGPSPGLPLRPVLLLKNPSCRQGEGPKEQPLLDLLLRIRSESWAYQSGALLSYPHPDNASLLRGLPFPENSTQTRGRGEGVPRCCQRLLSSFISQGPGEGLP